MTAGLRSLLSGSIDYAGTFPPAQRPLAEAIRRYTHHRAGPHAWLLGRFVCPAAQLHEAVEIAETAGLEAWSVSAVLSQSVGDNGFDGPNERDALHRFACETPSAATLRSIECRLLTTNSDDPSIDRLREFLAAACDWLLVAGIAPVELFVEPSLSGNWRGTIVALAEALARQDRREAGFDTNGSVVLGLKLRMGGVDPTVTPSPEQVAEVVRTCADLDVPWKATAGLHHPLSACDRGDRTRRFGFLNLISAAVLADVHRLPASEIARILVEDDPRGFSFDEEGFGWRGLRATTKKVLTARQTGLASFGSCSFGEPCEGLRGLGLLP